LFKGESLISNYPIEAKHRPQKKNLIKKPTPNIATTVSTVGESKMPFGKFKDKTISSIYKEDKNYLVWVYENVKFYPNQNWLKSEIGTMLKVS
jgi:hypothetical protein